MEREDLAFIPTNEDLPRGMTDEEQRQLAEPRPNQNEKMLEDRIAGRYLITIPHHRNWVMTAFQVSGVRCVEMESGCKMLSWEECADKSIQYKIVWSRNHLSLSPITTSGPSCEFHCLESGHYIFHVSTERGMTSDPCRVSVPESPEIHVDVLTSDRIRVTFDPVRYADKYRITVSYGTVSIRIETAECEYEIGELQFSFKKGIKYSVVVHAICNGILSMPSRRKEVITGLEKPLDFKCKLNHDDPQRSLKCSWKNSIRMSKAKIQLRTFENELLKEQTTARTVWDYWGLKPNKKYEIFLWPGDRTKFFDDDFIRHLFTTAPSSPKKVEFRRYKEERYLHFEVTSDYDGPFRVSVTDTSGKPIDGTPRIFQGKHFRINLPDERKCYQGEVQCKFGDYLTPPTKAEALGGHKCFEFEISRTNSSQYETNVGQVPDRIHQNNSPNILNRSQSFHNNPPTQRKGIKHKVPLHGSTFRRTKSVSHKLQHNDRGEERRVLDNETKSKENERVPATRGESPQLQSDQKENGEEKN